jgi:hypothetical protein
VILVVSTVGPLLRLEPTDLALVPDVAQ